MKSLCLFASYYAEQELPYYIRVYLKELKKVFSEVVLLVSKPLAQADLAFLEENRIQHLHFPNRGYDFGLWCRAFDNYDPEQYLQVALVNDSCVLFRSLEPFKRWVNSQKSELLGMTLSEAVSKHIQSYFLVLTGRAIPLTKAYFQKHGLISDLQGVIRTYEIGLCTFLLNQGIEAAAFVDNQGYKGEFSPYYYCIEYHLASGIPIIKKKVLFASYRPDEMKNLARMGFDVNTGRYYRLIAKKPDLLIDLVRLKSENKPQISLLQKLRFSGLKLLFRLGRPIYQRIKNVF